MYNSKGEQVSGFIRPAIRHKRPDCTRPQLLSTNGYNILAIIQLKMNDPIPMYEKKPTPPLYTPKQTTYTNKYIFLSFISATSLLN
jgi:hypothetical protein